jgi:hypothetical protein
MSNFSEDKIMKSLLLASALALAIAPALSAENQDEVKPPKSRPQAQTPHHVAPARTQVQAPHVQRNIAPTFQPNTTRWQPRTNPNVVNRTYRPDSTARFRKTIPNADQPRPTSRFQTDTTVQNRDWRNRTRTNTNTVVNPRTPRTTTTVQTDTNARNRDWRNRTNTNVQNQTTANFDQANASRIRRHHDRSWWRSRFNRFVLFGGGYYYWDNNYWYPAYGYDPYYSSYSYDEPIYGYQDMDPGQVIASVQTELQRLGYYRYAVDGVMGPATRAALANFQRDNGLAITAAIDRRTLQSLGLG